MFMKKLVMLAVVLALVAALAVPAFAQVSQELGNENESGDVDLSFSVTSTGDSSNQCVTPLQFGNTGSNQNAQGFLQYNSTADDLEGSGSEFVFAPSLSASCDQAVQQSSAAFSG
jgi:Tfp pilus assembly protein FimT